MRALALLPALLALALGAGCSTHVEEQASAAYAPVYPPEAQRSGPPTGAIYHAGAKGLFAIDKRASHVGDVLTVALNESFQATKSQSASTDKADTFAIDLPTGLGLGIDDGALDTGLTQSFSGEGTAEQSNSFTGLVTVTVTRVFANGNLEVLGQKKLTLGNGDEYVRVRGIVRPEDINNGNIVNSNRLANAEITYIGAGDIGDANQRGWLSRAITTIAPF